MITRLKWGVFLGVLAINISVACIWIPARLQRSKAYEHINEYWDRSEKIILAIIDLFLNAYFIYQVRSSLIAYGLTKYVRLYHYNLVMIAISMTMDVSFVHDAFELGYTKRSPGPSRRNDVPPKHLCVSLNSSLSS